ncbi:hypothetical protein NUW58_g2159 [Xylaria curta]|uniref:Uncharacterized protein n=1 Tax=Xylaria curta TaxID=42375 RepID=A0ACC1PI37_9PEZI|nr:hypothetical protein NUW58_g2159 [Xylaria curta]
MLIRPACQEDIPQAAAVAVAAYMDDAQDVYMYPNRASYPNLYLKAKSDIIKGSFEDPTALPIVAVLDETDGDWKGSAEIVGYCIWYREGPDAPQEDSNGPKSKQPTIKRILNRIRTYDIVDYLSDLANPILSASHARAMAKECSDPNSRQFEPNYTKPRHYFGVYDIGVDPKFQRRGVARKLMTWGIEKSKEENLPVFLSSTPAGKPLYLDLGFRTVGTWTWRPKQDLKWDIMQRDATP